MRELLEETLLLQTEWSAANTPSMERRGVLVRHEIASWMRDRVDALLPFLPPQVRDLAVEGKDGMGRKTEIPWARVYSESRSPSATEGWYVVYLFSAKGDRLYLTLGQGTTELDGSELRPRPLAMLRSRVEWARGRVGHELAQRPDAVDDIDLEATTRLGRSYGPGTVKAIAYDIDHIPDEGQLASDLEYMVRTLARLYFEADHSPTLPGELSPEVADAVSATNQAAGRRGRGQGFRLTAQEKSAIERRAVAVVSQHLRSEGWTVKDVGATSSFDLDARRNGDRLYVEVKGTTSLGEEVVLTRNEVELHRENHPHTMLAVVTTIDLDRTGPVPIASGGTLCIHSPWSPEDDNLTAIAYRYAVPGGGEVP
ncbi:DUF3578 domain-containing protein [Terrabacter sp. NPDC000476]|uniref:MrcB family domain-containing protein n=1 Tax=Terrabacter sp. NPDC000476 TaxID=3154258 RepID=UPI00333180D8